jgi:hypothetical protein
MTMKIASNGTTDDWQLGDFRINVRQDGLRWHKEHHQV